jgi:predicted TIM-barrel fold metal-dependent hydrolase
VAPVAVFDAHLHIIDPRFPLVANQGYVPDPFTADDYRAATAGLNVIGGAVVAGSFQPKGTVPQHEGTVPQHEGTVPQCEGTVPQQWLRDALQRLGSGFVGVVELDPVSSDDDIVALDAAGVRAIRFNLHRGGTLDERLAHRVHEVAGWHTEVYADGATLAALEDRLRRLPRLSVDHLGLDSRALPVLQRLGCRVKATGFGRVDVDVEATLEALDPDKLLFGTDLPGTRARRPFERRDLELVAKIAPQALADNAREWYRPRA